MVDYLKKIDWIMLATVFFIFGIGLASIYSFSISRGDFIYFEKQIIFFAFGIFFIFLIGFFDWRIFRQSPYFILAAYFICILLLVGLFLLAPETRGIKGWYKFGFFSLDPVEPMKVILTILLAKYFSMRHIEMYKLRHIFLSSFYLILPSVLIFFQPNFGSAMILAALWVGVLIISGIKLKHFLILCFAMILILSLAWLFLLKDYQQARIISFFSPQVEPLGISWHQTQAKIAIGSGGLFGKGFTNGSQAMYGFLPEPHTDFIFSAIAEELGFMGISVLLILFLILLWRIIRISLSAESNFPRLFASGMAIILFFHIIINVGMNLSILPVIGISLPLVSYGGSNLIFFCIGLGILQSIRAHK
ncbi:MAG: hypothetical protein A3F95_00325 [Candidatus Nealsonbacteria bacterium RIFCSPLOWO2_12_FULL_39_31]|uniref:Rod shape-determining protein RodA n=3 Tax=Candidatus Nealsoniibacteriota TaxID=1817911 RepID=A0A1G2EI33_9BACT|nr:MAG: hypothetical protein US88_C0014G0005 [Parcubacteria group bacterium GW2011_GWA2_38_27]KKQ97322.1 MAG: hypothetical protein UT22_C0012G0006 [Parcubacteria group bacterium GW2011_GWC2_39_11]OGZ20243.1 MAG: hypothetical protein A2626_03255 [Candidatus Nealsonbacteria bacterium RIFCSPHIGHO2_01_FULL_38_55]OGZ20826.1 MAG: hypothetical protein A2W55_00365 [Candidatus Nealsonbacteria bacterium RIFCSPHIGHO2_02_38_10]OGZ20862.1 MAG: hypothetical protein A3C48_01510 [Candidatus Nealsonbacteria bac